MEQDFLASPLTLYAPLKCYSWAVVKGALWTAVGGEDRPTEILL